MFNYGNTCIHSSRHSLYCRSLFGHGKKLTKNCFRYSNYWSWRIAVNVNNTWLQQGEPPITGGDAVSFSDPLPQALILTAIVINFATMGFFLVLAYRSYKELGTDDMDKLRGTEDD